MGVHHCHTLETVVHPIYPKWLACQTKQQQTSSSWWARARMMMAINNKQLGLVACADYISIIKLTKYMQSLNGAITVSVTTFHLLKKWSINVGSSL